jgi:hypothetical protein
MMPMPGVADARKDRFLIGADHPYPSCRAAWSIGRVRIRSTGSSRSSTSFRQVTIQALTEFTSLGLRPVVGLLRPFW